jgi:NADH:ubiquinone oxidoreductase subunit E
MREPAFKEQKPLPQPPGKQVKVGAVAVVGAGIGGIQASLDLAEAGFKVYLVEQGPSIGGVMGQLDKTFPTNDCAMCILSPKLVEASRHPNVELLAYSEVEEMAGEAGSFTLTVRKKARSVDAAKCTGCGACMAACPVQNIIRVPESFDEESCPEQQAADEVIERHGCGRNRLIEILQEIQARYNYLPEAALRRVSSRLAVPFAEVYGMASFYKAFSLEPRGRHIIQVCLGTACHVRGADRIVAELEKLLAVRRGGTTADGEFTLETVNCLGACALGPIMRIDKEYHGKMTTRKVAECLNSFCNRGNR